MIFSDALAPRCEVEKRRGVFREFPPTVGPVATQLGHLLLQRKAYRCDGCDLHLVAIEHNLRDACGCSNNSSIAAGRLAAALTSDDALVDKDSGVTERLIKHLCSEVRVAARIKLIANTVITDCVRFAHTSSLAPG